jgi:hypothetical protein
MASDGADTGAEDRILIERGNPNVMLAGCETHRFKSFIKRPGGNVEHTTMYGVTDVLVPTHLRGERGHLYG